MQPWRIFSLFLLLLSCSTLIYFGVRFGRELWVYSSLTGKSAAKVTRWDIEEEGSRYAIWAVYEYESKEKILINRARFPGPLFLNEEAAEKELRAKSKQSITAYYDPSNPTRSALGRAFPTSYGIRCIISFLILVYFFSFKKKLKSIFNQ